MIVVDKVIILTGLIRTDVNTRSDQSLWSHTVRTRVGRLPQDKRDWMKKTNVRIHRFQSIFISNFCLKLTVKSPAAERLLSGDMMRTPEISPPVWRTLTSRLFNSTQKQTALNIYQQLEAETELTGSSLLSVKVMIDFSGTPAPPTCTTPCTAPSPPCVSWQYNVSDHSLTPDPRAERQIHTYPRWAEPWRINNPTSPVDPTPQATAPDGRYYPLWHKHWFHTVSYWFHSGSGTKNSITVVEVRLLSGGQVSGSEGSALKWRSWWKSEKSSWTRNYVQWVTMKYLANEQRSVPLLTLISRWVSQAEPTAL